MAEAFLPKEWLLEPKQPRPTRTSQGWGYEFEGRFTRPESRSCAN